MAGVDDARRCGLRKQMAAGAAIIDARDDRRFRVFSRIFAPA
jgi:hypothetical protein